MHLRCALDHEHKARGFSVLIPLTLALSHPGEGIFRRNDVTASAGRNQSLGD
jgi:hypothetical protein